MEMTFLLISFIFHGISFIVIFLLFQKLKDATESERQFEKRVSEVEDLFNSYLLELKDENKKFLGLLTHLEQLQQHDKDEPDIVSENENDNSKRTHEERVHHTIQNDELTVNLGKEKKRIEADHIQVERIEVQDRYEAPSIEAQIMQLYASGLNTEEIAKKLNRGRTEVELIIKFNSKNERINT